MNAHRLGTLALEGGGHVSAASGLVSARGCLYVIADDQHQLAVFPPGRLVRLLSGELPRGHAERKAAKPDFEALVALDDDTLLAIGSGSTPARERAVRWRIGGEPEVLDLGPLYARLREHAAELNVEGACMHRGELVLLLRGANLVARVDLAASSVLGLRAYELPGGLGFTDADVLPDGRIVFSAAAEDTPNAYDDGPVSGSAIGCIGPGGELEWLEWVEPRGIKVEGIAVRDDELLMVCDADDPDVPSPLLTTRVPRTPAPE